MNGFINFLFFQVHFQSMYLRLSEAHIFISIYQKKNLLIHIQYIDLDLISFWRKH